MRALRVTTRKRSDNDGALGTKMGVQFSFCWTAVLAIVPRIWSPSAIAVDILFKNTAATPSPLQYPSALASNGLQDPEGLKNDAPARFWNQIGFVIM